MSVYGNGTGAEDETHQLEFMLNSTSKSFSQQGEASMFESEPIGNKNDLQAICDINDFSAAQLFKIANLKMRNKREIQHQRQLLLRIVKQKMEIRQLRRKLDFARHVEAESLGLIQSPYLEIASSAELEQAAEGDESWASCDSAGVSNIEDYASSFSGELAEMSELEAGSVRLSHYIDELSSLDMRKEQELLRDILELYLYDFGEDDVSSISSRFRRTNRRNVPSSTGNLKKPNQVPNIVLFKTEMCRSWTEFGMCPYGNNCRFAHGYGELRVKPKPHKYKTERCKKFLAGYCPYGSRCCFVHELCEQQRTSVDSAEDEKLPEQNRVTRRRWRPTPMHNKKKHLQIKM